MEQKIDVKQALRVFQHVLDHGEKTGEDEWSLEGVFASPNTDGYVATLRNDYVRMDIQFHNTYNLDFLNTKERDAFLEKIVKIDKHLKKSQSPTAPEEIQ